MQIVLFLLFLIFLELLYSLYKKDGIYSFKSLQVNILTQFFGLLKDFCVPLASVIGIIFLINGAIPHLYTISNTIFSFLLCLLLMDFLYYLFHRASHAFLLLWAFHFVHHSDKKFNLSVGFRSSWFEMIGLFLTYSVLLLIGFSLPLFLTVFSITSTYQFLTHGRYWNTPSWFQYVFVTEKYHLIHHGEELVDQKSNFGGVFIFWDRLFSTHSKDREVITFGIKGYSQDNLIKIQTDPLFKYFKKEL